MSNKLRWKKNPRETGLRAIAANPRRGSVLHDGVEEYASIGPVGGGWNTGEFRGWYWCAFTNKEKGIALCNTVGSPPYTTEKDAKDAARKYIDECLSRAVNDAQSQ